MHPLARVTNAASSTPTRIESGTRRIIDESVKHRRAMSHEETPTSTSERRRSASFAVQKQANDEQQRKAANIRSIQNETAMAAMRLNPPSPGEPDPSIVEGFREDVSVFNDASLI